MRERDIQRRLIGELDDIESLYELYDSDDTPNAEHMRRGRAQLAPGTRGRLTEEARDRLVKRRRATATGNRPTATGNRPTATGNRSAAGDDGPAAGERWSTWARADERGPRPRPSWLITEPTAADTELGILKTGKEADVFLVERALPGGERACLLAAKRYRCGDHRLFHRDAGYLEGRRVRASREMRAMQRRSQFGRNLIAQQWAVAEFDALRRLWRAGAPVPYPVQRIGTELLLKFIGDADGTAAPRLAQLRPTERELAELWRQLLDAMLLLARGGHTHGDLSAYNLLVHGEALVLIDLPQLVDVIANPQGRAFLERDVRTACAWFVSRGLRASLVDPDVVVELLLGEAGLG